MLGCLSNIEAEAAPVRTTRTGTALSRIGRYVSGYGLRFGVFHAAEHLFRFRLAARGAVASTKGPDGDVVFLRSRTSDLATFREIFIDREYELMNLSTFPKILSVYNTMIAANNTPLVIDAGANIGLGSIFLSRLFPAASFILVEPDQDNVAIAALNVKQHANMSIVQCALWHETTRLYIRTSRDASTLKVISERESGAVAVATTTINELIAGRKDDLFLVKMDIEGAESNVLSLNCAWLDALPILLIEPHDQWQPNNNSLAGVLSIPEYRKADIIVNNKIIIFIPRRFCA